MSTMEVTSSWEKIRQGVTDAEKLIGQKQYNLSMVKSRQTLEYMVRCLAEKACMVEGDLSVTIDELYQGRWISKTTCEHYHKIRMLGNKAVHDGNDNAYDANQAYHLLSQEVYTFANDYNGKKRKPAGSAPSTSSSTRSRKKAKQSGFQITPTDLLRILIAILCVVFIFAIVKFFIPGKDSPEETSPAVTTEATLPETTSTPETMAQTTPAPVYKTTTVLNVRSEPSTSSRVLGQLPTDTVVEYVGAHDDTWSIITYDGQQAYVSSQYLVHD